MSNSPPKPRRSLLFVPASRPERYAKALASGADMVCLDLEDAVAPADKASARAAALEFLQNPPDTRCELVLRVNSLRSPDGLADMLAVLAAGRSPDYLLLPKVNSAAEVRWYDELLGHRPSRLIPMIETAEGLTQANDIAAASSRTALLMFGGVDLASDVGCAMEWQAQLYQRSAIVIAAARAGLDVLDVPHIDVADADGLAQIAGNAKKLGFTGKTAIHPNQIAAIHAAFTPSDAEIAKAKRVIETFEAAEGRVMLLDGKLLEKPVIRAAQRVLAAVAS